MNTNEIKASRRLIRVDSCPFVVQSALSLVDFDVKTDDSRSGG